MYNKKMQFLYARDQAKMAETKETALQKTRKRAAEAKKTYEAAVEKNKELLWKHEEVVSVARLAAEKATLAEERMAAGKQEVEKASETREENERALRDKETAIGLRRKDMRDLEERIRGEKSKSNRQNAQAERAKLNADLERLEIDGKAFNEKITTEGKKRVEVTEHNNELRTKRNQLTKLRTDTRHERVCFQNKLDAVKRQAERQGETGLALRFGQDIQNLVDHIDREERRFKVKPIGPIGRHVKLVENAAKDKDLADLIKSELNKKFLEHFLVDNVADSKQLELLFEKHFCGKKPPIIVRMKFTQKRFDVSMGRVAATDDYCTVLDYLEIDNEDVFNYVVERGSVESTLVMTDAKAQELFSVANLVPRNARKAITKEFYRYSPQTDTANYSSFYINRWNTGRNCLVAADQGEMEIATLQGKLVEVEESMSGLESELRNLQNKFNDGERTLEDIKRQTDIFRKDMATVLSDKQRVMASLNDLDDLNKAEAWSKTVDVYKNEIDELLGKVGKLKEEGKKAAAEERDAEARLRAKSDEVARLRASQTANTYYAVESELARAEKLVVSSGNAVKAFERQLVKEEAELQKVLDSERSFREKGMEMNDGEVMVVNETKGDLLAEHAEQKKQYDRKIVELNIGENEDEFKAKYERVNSEANALHKELGSSEGNVIKAQEMQSTRSVTVWEKR